MTARSKWRELRPGELIDIGDQYYSVDRQRWLKVRYAVGMPYVPREWPGGVRRKEIA